MRILIPICDGGYVLRGALNWMKNSLISLEQIDTNNEYIIIHDNFQQNFFSPQHPNFILHKVNAPNGRLNIHFWYYNQFSKLIKTYKPDIIHYPNTFYIPQKVGKTIYTIHDLAEFELPEKHGFLKSLARRKIVHNNVKHADRVITVSDYTKSKILEFTRCPENKISIIHNIVFLDKFVRKNNSNEKHKLFENGFFPEKYFLYVGAIERTKNIETVIRALSILNHEKKQNVNLVLVSSFGKTLNQVKRMVRQLRLENSVLFTEFLEEDVLIKIFQNAIALIHPSIMEGFGLVLLQAMAAGIPIIASNASAMPEVFGDAAIAVEPFSETQFADAMIRILKTASLRSELIEKGYKRLELFSDKITANKLLHVYEELYNR